jgi:LCP family protein required for cell wall assembly
VGCLLLAFFGLMIPVFGCGLSLLTYLMFPPPPQNILVVGLDSRGAEDVVSRTDSMMVLGVSPRQLRVSALSIPRDLFLETPGYGLQRVNTINVLGEQETPGQGMSLLKQSIGWNFGIRVDRYVRLDFQTFVELVNAVGGVHLYVERAIVDNAYPTDEGGVTSARFESGWQYMDGERALMYARTRHADDDYHRAARQQQVLSALLERLANPARWPTALRLLSESLDTDLKPGDLIALAPPVILNGGRFDSFVINRDFVLGTASGNAIPDYARIQPWLEGRFE